MKKVIYNIPYVVYGTPDTINTLNAFCSNESIGRIYSRFYEMNQALHENKRLEALMNSLGFTGKSNAFVTPPVYEVQQWYGYNQDEEAIEQLLTTIGE